MPIRPPSPRGVLAGAAGLLSLAVASAAAAQPIAGDPLARAWSFGLLAGVNVASFAGDDAEGLDDARTGLVVGGFAVRRLSPVLAFAMAIPAALWSVSKARRERGARSSR